VTRLDQTIDRAADKLQALAARAAGQDGLKAKLAEPLAEDAAFLRKLKPSLIAARMRAGTNGAAPAEPPPPPPAPANPEPPPAAAAAPEPTAPPPKRNPKPSGGPSPWLFVGAALVVGVVAAKVLDWRGHAHPRD